jgi:cytidyltransferase-like protein
MSKRSAPSSTTKKVFVSGCFDCLHTGHVAFFEEASHYGDLHVGIGSDSTIKALKGRPPVNNEVERLYHIKSLRSVSHAFINSGSGFLDFADDLATLRPDIFVVNDDGYSQEKSDFCRRLNIELIVLQRRPAPQLPSRSTTDIRAKASQTCALPYRIDLAGTWIDQPYVSKHSSDKGGWAITVSLEPIIEYTERCGMSTSTRNKAKELWPFTLPVYHSPIRTAEILFRWDNQPGTTTVSGAQDSLGICLPGLSRHFYYDEYWPSRIESIHDEKILVWLEQHLFMVELWPRDRDLDLLKVTFITPENVKKLTDAAAACWQAILTQDYAAFVESFNASFAAQIAMFPAMTNRRVDEEIQGKYRSFCDGYKLAGAGGGGYLIMCCRERPVGVDKLLDIRIRRKEGSL